MNLGASQSSRPVGWDGESGKNGVEVPAKPASRGVLDSVVLGGDRAHLRVRLGLSSLSLLLPILV